MQDLTKEEVDLVVFHLNIRLDDYEKTINKEERKQKKKLNLARKQWSNVARIVAKLKPSILSSDWKLMDDTVIKKQKET